jgi:hypothetical protein
MFYKKIKFNQEKHLQNYNTQANILFQSTRHHLSERTHPSN